MLAVTGANGHLGMRLMTALSGDGVRALVRSTRAECQVRDGLGERIDVRVVDYRDAGGLAEALDGCRTVVHLVGILKESGAGSYRDAHQRACLALAEAAGRVGLRQMVYLSILGASPASGNACLASKGAAERILLDAAVPAAVIRVPMVLGEGDFASRALAARAHRGINVVLRAESLEQPIYAGDVVAAMLAATGDGAAAGSFDLAGPESLSRAALIRRAAGVLGRRTRVLSLPLMLGLVTAGMLERLSREPPVTRAMLGVLDHDDHIDPGPAARALGIELTCLDETLRRCLAGTAAV
jgi:uncharacterized protein YbjT (DUF2867 family)